MMVKHTILYQQLKPRLRKQVLDYVFKHFYKTFDIIFQDCDHDFKRDIFYSSKYRHLMTKRSFTGDQDNDETEPDEP